jgi:hypothetical protein
MFERSSGSRPSRRVFQLIVAALLLALLPSCIIVPAYGPPSPHYGHYYYWH